MSTSLFLLPKLISHFDFRLPIPRFLLTSNPTSASTNGNAGVRAPKAPVDHGSRSIDGDVSGNVNGNVSGNVSRSVSEG